MGKNRTDFVLDAARNAAESALLDRSLFLVNTGNSILGAMEIESRYQVSFWDALVIQAAQDSGAAILYSEDLADGQRYGGVEVKNPLRNQREQLA